MNAAVMHEADMALTKLKMSRCLDPAVEALLALIEAMEAEAEIGSLEIARLRRIEELASDAYDYHRLGYQNDDEPWSAERMLSLMNDLGEVL